MTEVVRKLVANAFSLAMLSDFKKACIDVEQISKDTFCEEIENAKSYIGHESTAKLLTQICKKTVDVNRDELKLRVGDTLLVVQLRVRLPEGKVLTIDELQDLLRNNLIIFYRVVVRHATS